MQIEPLGDRAILVRLASSVDEATNRLVRAALAALDRRAVPGVVDLVPGFTGVAVHYDPARVFRRPGETPHAALERALTASLRDIDQVELPAPRTIELPVRYGGEYGPDLAEVASHTDLPEDEVVRRHAARRYLVHMLGFAPGFPYLGGLDPALAVPRLVAPRVSVPAGSVGIGGAQTGIYPVESPGGWRLIGRTPLRLFDPARDPATLLRAGDHVRFVPITDAEFRALERGS